MDTNHKVKENRLRRMAERQGLTFGKVRRIDRRATDYGLVRLSRNGILQFESAYIDEVERYLTTDPDDTEETPK